MAEVDKVVLLQSADGEMFEVPSKVIRESGTIRNMIEDECAEDVIPVPNVTSKILAKVIEFCKQHVEARAGSGADEFFADEAIKKYDADFVKVDQDTLFDFIMAANYLNVKELLDLTCKAVADQMRGKTPEEIRRHFHIVNDYTPEEEEEVRRENMWAFA